VEIKYTFGPSGSIWPLEVILEQVLQQAEELFGERDQSFEILGIECQAEDQPCVFFRDGYEQRRILIQLTSACSLELNRAIFQLTHEVVHCLFPKLWASVLEEGLTTWFSLHFKFGPYVPLLIEREQYQRAYDLVAPMLAQNPEGIKEYRKKDPTLSLLQPQWLQEQWPDMSLEQCKTLCLRFEDYTATFQKPEQ
jgi:hypothetical protein